jgi:hypothetical protein
MCPPPEGAANHGLEACATVRPYGGYFWFFDCNLV